MNINCPNCGAPIDNDKHKCSYCGTPYFDMSFMNFEDRKPFFLKIKYKDMYITQLVRPQLGSISLTCQNAYVTGGRGNVKLCSFPFEEELTTDISFTSIPHNNVLFTVEKE